MRVNEKKGYSSGVRLRFEVEVLGGRGVLYGYVIIFLSS